MENTLMIFHVVQDNAKQHTGRAAKDCIRCTSIQPKQD
jgi:hypothetical protein